MADRVDLGENVGEGFRRLGGDVPMESRSSSMLRTIRVRTKRSSSRPIATDARFSAAWRRWVEAVTAVAWASSARRARWSVASWRTPSRSSVAIPAVSSPPRPIAITASPWPSRRNGERPLAGRQLEALPRHDGEFGLAVKPETDAEVVDATSS